MSTSEYNDLYLKCQETGRYHMFVFDMVDSKKMSFPFRRKAQVQMVQLMRNMYRNIQEIEYLTNKKILVFEDDFVEFDSGKSFNGFGFKQEPFIFGDTFGFTIHRDSLDKDFIYYLYEKNKQELGIEFDFHLADGYYETNDYVEGRDKYFRGYCLDLLSTLHKSTTKKDLEKLKKKLKD